MDGSRHPGESRDPGSRGTYTVMDSGLRRNDEIRVAPAKAGAQVVGKEWIPAFAGMTTEQRLAPE